jgi:hypothetical protein
MSGLGDSYGNTDPVEGTDLPSSDLLNMASDWGTATAPTLPDPPASSKRMVASARPPASPSTLVEQVFGPASSPTTPGFSPPTTGGDMLFGLVPLPTWLPKWAVYSVGLAALAFAADYGYRHYVGGGRASGRPKARRRVARNTRLVEGDEHDDDDDDGDDGVDERDLVERAADFREKFHWGIKGKKVRRAKVPKPPRVATKLGELTSVIYKTKKRGEKAQFFHHDFGEEGGRKPTLAMDIENKKLHIVGGDYDVQADGIID